MSHGFKFVIKNPESESEKRIEIDITDESMKNYKSYGVWALYGQDNKNLWKCLQVGQSQNIGSEIIYDKKCLLGEIKSVKDRKYINQFGQVVEDYTYDVHLTPRQQIYKKIGDNYENFRFECICCGNECNKDQIKAIERYVAWELQALFWRNGGSFKEANDNVKKPENIDDSITANIKNTVDNIKKWYDAK